MSNSQDLLNIVASFSLILLTGTIVCVSVVLVRTLQSIRDLTDSLEDTTRDIQAVKDGLKVGALTLLSTFLSKLRGGER